MGLYEYRAGHTLSEDLLIGTEIAKSYGLELNKGLKTSTYRIDAKESFSYAMMVKCGFHKGLASELRYFNKPKFRIMGAGGEALRSYWNMPINEFIQKESMNYVFKHYDYNRYLEKVLTDSAESLASIDDINSGAHCFYPHIRMRNHFGKASIVNFSANIIILAPLMDPVLYKLKQNNSQNDDLLFALLYERFAEKIKDLPFDSSRVISQQIKNEASRINRQFPLLKEEISAFSIKEADRIKPKEHDYSLYKSNPYEIIQQLYHDEKIKDLVVGFYDKNVYDLALEYFHTSNHHP